MLDISGHCTCSFTAAGVRFHKNRASSLYYRTTGSCLVLLASHNGSTDLTAIAWRRNRRKMGSKIRIAQVAVVNVPEEVESNRPILCQHIWVWRLQMDETISDHLK